MADLFRDFTSDDNDTELRKIEPKKDNEDGSDKEIIVVEERVTPDPEFITLEELADSDFIRSRQLAARSIVENLHQAGSNKEALHSVISVMCKLSEDEDSIVRSELIEQLPSIALFCKEHSENLGVVIRQQIVPYTVKLLTDIQRPIRKTGHSVLIVLLENNIIDHSQLSEWICPLIAQLVTSENIPEELKLEDASVMCKMIPYIGKEITEKFFLEPFLTVCRDSTSSAREVCMLNFGTISQAIGREVTEKVLLPTFLELSQESSLVKLKCVNIVVELATAVSSRIRNEVLSPIYVDFLKSESRMVSHAACLNLGRFISTFAEPSNSGLKYKDGMWVNVEEENDCTDDFLHCHQYHQEKHFDLLTSKIISKPEFLEECSFKNLNSTFDVDFDELSSTVPSSIFYNCKLEFDASETCRSSSYSSENYCDSVFISNFKNLVANKNSSSKLSNLSSSQKVETKSSAISSMNIPSKEKNISRQVHNENIFNNFQFWRMPLPEVDFAIEECKSSNLKSNLEQKLHSYTSNLALILPTKPKEPDILQDTDDSKLSEEGRESPELNLKNLYVQFTKKHQQPNILFCKEKPDNQVSLNEKHMTDTEKMVYDQDIVPPEILMEYINEATSSDEVVKNLAYYFPSVVYVLGRKHWPCIRDLFNTLSSMLQFSIKKTVASSLHDLAIILGPEITTEDLLPVFLKMLQDLGVRYTSSLMQNVSTFLKKTKPEARRQFLPLIEELCSWDYDDHNWRYRLIISEQLTLSVELFSCHEALFFLPASLLILQDKVSAVRRSGVELLAVIIKSVATNPDSSTFIKATLCALDEKCRKSNKWLLRQLYVFMCQDLAAKRSLSTEFYVEVVVPNLLSLTWDAVPNVRLAVARCMALTLLPLGFLPTIEKMHYSLLLQVLYSLQNDVDKDVRHFGRLCVPANGIFNSDAPLLDKESTASELKENDEQLENCL